MEQETVHDHELEIIIKAWRDESFRKKLFLNPKSAIEHEFSLIIPKDMNIFVHEEGEKNMHLIVPKVPPSIHSEKMSDDDLKTVIGGVAATGHLTAFPISRDHSRILKLQKENEQQKKMIIKLEKYIEEIEKKIFKSGK